MSGDDVLFGYRLRVLDYAARTTVSEACRVFGIRRSTYYVEAAGRAARAGDPAAAGAAQAADAAAAVAVCRGADRRVRAQVLSTIFAKASRASITR
jgi:hypothetical protein